jgi:2-C-methyl-D-erythritol 4-phosphate cytidylyltransferase
MSRHIALLPAAGVGTRMGVDLPKQYLPLAGRPMLWHAIRAFEAHRAIARTYVVLSATDRYWDSFDWAGLSKLTVVRCGGNTRAASVLNGLEAMAAEVAEDDWILVHDAARPCLSPVLLDRLLAELDSDPVGGILAIPVADTLKRAGEGARIRETVPREALWAAQTPQMFRYRLLRQALEHAGTAVTDEASAVEALGLAPRLVESDLTNLKVTYPRDLEVAAWLLSRREVAAATSAA